MTSTLRFWAAAACSGLYPSAERASRSLPPFKSTEITAEFPLYCAAKCSGVNPRIILAFASAPAARIVPTTTAVLL